MVRTENEHFAVFVTGARLTTHKTMAKLGYAGGSDGGLHMATEASNSLGLLRTTCSSCPESETS